MGKSDSRSGPRAGRAPRRGETRSHVLDIACALFNQAGPDRTTTRAIADQAGINEGNLYYYFRTKEALVLALFDRFEGVADAIASGWDGQDPSDYQRRIRNWFALTWDYRFLFRDAVSLQLIAPSLRPRLRRLSMRMQRNVRLLLRTIGEAGLLLIGPEEQERLLANLWIVSSYWIAYLTTHRGVRQIAPRHLDWGFAQVRSLYWPYLSPLGRSAQRTGTSGSPVPETSGG